MTMRNSAVFWLLWLGFVGYAFGFAPPDTPDTWPLIQNLSAGNWEGINPSVIALFNLMGIWPMIYACILFIDGRGQRVRAFPFVVGSFFVGAFALLPYLGLRKPGQPFEGPKTWFLRLQDSRWLAGAIALGAIPLLGYGLTQGNWAEFGQQWQTSRFIHVMSLDFCLLWLLFPVLMADDMARRGMANPSLWRAIALLLPMVGALLYLLARPSLVGSPNAPDTPGDRSAPATAPSES